MSRALLRRAVASIALAATVAIGPAARAATGGEQADAADVKAAFIYNFAKFAEWPDMAASDPIVICVLDEPRVAASLSSISRGQRIAAHPVEIVATDAAARQACRVLYLSMPVNDALAALEGVRRLPTLTVSDVRGFASRAGMIELFVEGDRMRFAVNVAAVQRTGIKLSSRLLGLARIVRDDHAQ